MNVGFFSQLLVSRNNDLRFDTFLVESVACSHDILSPDQDWSVVCEGVMPIGGTLIHSFVRGLSRAFFLVLMLTILITEAFAEGRFAASVGRGTILVANPSMEDPNFRHTVLLILEHGRNGTIGVVLNRTTEVLLSEVLPDLVVLKGTQHRLFTGGPVGRTQLVLLFRLKDPRPDTRLIVDGIYMGTPRVLERILTQPQPSETFRAFSGFAGWAPGQLQYELLDEAWGVLPADSLNIFDTEPATLWKDAIHLLQIPRSISQEYESETSFRRPETEADHVRY